MTERHLQNSKGFVRRADDNTNDIKTLNRSIFIPAITFDKSKKRQEQDARMNRRYEEEQADREATQRDIQDTHNSIANATRGTNGRYGRDGPPPDDDEEALNGGGRFRTPQQMQARKAQWAKYQSKDDDEEDDAMEDEISTGLDEMSLGIQRIKDLALAQNKVVKQQNEQLSRLHRNVEDVDQRLSNTTEKARLSTLDCLISILTPVPDAPHLDRSATIWATHYLQLRMIHGHFILDTIFDPTSPHLNLFRLDTFEL